MLLKEFYLSFFPVGAGYSTGLLIGTSVQCFGGCNCQLSEHGTALCMCLKTLKTYDGGKGHSCW